MKTTTITTDTFSRANMNIDRVRNETFDKRRHPRQRDRSATYYFIYKESGSHGGMTLSETEWVVLLNLIKDIKDAR